MYNYSESKRWGTDQLWEYLRMDNLRNLLGQAENATVLHGMNNFLVASEALPDYRAHEEAGEAIDAFIAALNNASQTLDQQLERLMRQQSQLQPLSRPLNNPPAPVVLDPLFGILSATMNANRGHAIAPANSVDELCAVYEAIGQPQRDDKCMICLSKLKRATRRNKQVQFGCSHRFHESCVREWLKTSASCPTCRNRLEIE